MLFFPATAQGRLNRVPSFVLRGLGLLHSAALALKPLNEVYANVLVVVWMHHLSDVKRHVSKHENGRSATLVILCICWHHYIEISLWYI